jgi:hypothetical protein
MMKVLGADDPLREDENPLSYRDELRRLGPDEAVADLLRQRTWLRRLVRDALPYMANHPKWCEGADMVLLMQNWPEHPKG